MMATEKDVRKIALGLGQTLERPSYGTPGFFVGKKIFARLLEDGDSVVVKIDPERREILMQADPRAYFITEHYRNYPMMIVRLSKVATADLRELLQDAWRIASGD
jgi:hypothetical protein